MKPSPAGYSGTPLPKKLGIKEGSRCAFLGAPPEFAEALGTLPAGVDVKTAAKPALDVIVLFTTSRADLAKRFPAAAKALAPTGGLWVAWPKKASGAATDLTEDVVRAVGLPTGLVDNKVCAIDATWSGLRFVLRLKDRG
jgi:hypothetical protein